MVKISFLYIRFFSTALFLMACNPLYAGYPSRCTLDERTIFSCGFKNKKIVSVCASRENDTAPYVEYRFGLPAQTEIQYRAENHKKDRKFHRAEVLYANNSEKVLWFRNHDVAYLIHMPMRGDPQLEVMKDDATLATLTCNRGWAGVRGSHDIPASSIVEHGSITATEMSKLLAVP